MISPPRGSQTKKCYDHLRRQLLHGQLAPGSRLVEEKWAEMLGVHRSAVREALLLLAHDGLLIAGPRGGYFVPEYDRAALDEVLEVRISLEVGALRAVELRGGFPAPDAARLRRACELMRQNMEAGFEFGFAEADRHFHEVLVQAAGNARLARVYKQAPLPIAPFPAHDDDARLGNMAETLADHETMCDLLEAGKLDDAVTLLRRHLLRDHSTLTPAGDPAPAADR